MNSKSVQRRLATQMGQPAPPVGPRICVDFDGVIHEYKTPFTEVHIISDGPVEGAIEWLSEMVQHFEVFVCSARGCFSVPEGEGREKGRLAIERWLEEMSEGLWWHGKGKANPRGIREVRVVTQKPGAIAYIDDRGWRFMGPGFFPSKDALLKSRPWNKMGWKEGEL